MLASLRVLHTSSLQLESLSVSSSSPSCSALAAFASPATSMMACVIDTSRLCIQAQSAQAGQSMESTTTATATTIKQTRLPYQAALHCDCCEAKRLLKLHRKCSERLHEILNIAKRHGTLRLVAYCS